MMKRSLITSLCVGAALVAAGCIPQPNPPVDPPETGYERLLGLGGAEPNATVVVSDVSDNGRFVSFTSSATNMVADDTVFAPGPFGELPSELFVWDRTTDAIERQPFGTSVQANMTMDGGSMSGDGRYVAFAAHPTSITGFNATRLFVWDRTTGTLRRQPDALGAADPVGSHGRPTLSGNGRFVVFSSDASNLVAGDTNGRSDIHVWDTQTGTVQRLAGYVPGVANPTGNQLGGISDDGRYISFATTASLPCGDRCGIEGPGSLITTPVFVGVWDRTTETINRQPAGIGGADPEPGNGWTSVISPDGTKVAFMSDATNLVAGDGNGHGDVFVWERTTGAVTRQPESAFVEAGGRSQRYPGNFTTDGTKLLVSHQYAIPPSGYMTEVEIGVWNLTTGATTLAPVGIDGQRPTGRSPWAVIAGDGSLVAFTSSASNLVAGDDAGVSDLFTSSLRP